MTNKPDIKVVKGKVFINGKRAKHLPTMSDRKCYVADGVIVKLNDKRLRQSSRELRVWNTIEEQDKKYFIEPIDGQIRGNGWIAQLISKFRRGRRSRAAWNKAEQLADKYNILNDCRESDGEFCFSVNWAIDINGDLKIYDWGY